MILNLCANEYLRLTQARGTALEVLEGAVWVTEAGRHADALVERGRRFEVGGDGLVLVGTDTRATGSARIALRPATAPALEWLLRRAASLLELLASGIRARQTAVALAALSDRSLRDIGLRRDQIESVARGRGPLQLL